MGTMVITSKAKQPRPGAGVYINMNSLGSMMGIAKQVQHEAHLSPAEEML